MKIRKRAASPCEHAATKALRLTCLATVSGFALWSQVAHAGGLARPNGLGAANAAQGGAVVATVDDPTAVYVNPAALAFLPSQVLLGGEFVSASRTYTPIDAAGTRGADQSTTTNAAVPLAGGIGRFSYSGQPSRFSLGGALLNTFGGRLRYDKTGMPAIDATSNVVLEAIAGAAFEFSDKLSIGASLRLGIGSFESETTDRPLTSKGSASGLGVGMTAGAQFRPSRKLTIGVVWRSPLTVRTTGTTVVQFPSGPGSEQLEFTQKWPQQAAASIAVTPVAKLTIAAQAEWQQWSRLSEVNVLLPKQPLLSQQYLVDWNDTIAVRLGASFRASPRLVLRTGGYFDSGAVPLRTAERHYLDNPKLGLAGGARVDLGKWSINFAVDAVLPNRRTVPDNSMAVSSWSDLINRAPGTHQGAMYSGQLALGRRL